MMISLLSNQIYVWLVFTIALGNTLCFADEEKAKPLFRISGKVVDDSKNPLHGVLIVSSFIQNPKYKSTTTTTNRDGEFSLEYEPDDSGSLQVLFHKPGYACDLSESYSKNRKPFVVQLEPEVPVPVQVVDAQGKPVAGASVSPFEILFRNEFIQTNIDEVSVERFGLISITDQFGMATVRGTRPENLLAVCVKVQGHAPSHFRIPKNTAELGPGQPLRLAWQAFSGKLKCRVAESNGEIARDMYLFVSSSAEDSNALRDKTPTPFTELLRKIDSQGFVKLDVASHSVELYANSFHRGIAHSLGTATIVNGGTTEVSFQLPATCSVVASILDLSNSSDTEFEGLTITLRNKEGNRYTFATGVTNEDGIAEFEVTAGDWEFAEARGDLPSGYLFDEMHFKITVKDPSIPIATPPITVRRGRTISGVISGVDCAALRHDFVIATYHAGDSEQESYGKVDCDGRFTIAIPPGIADTQITNVEISFAPKTNRRSLAILSRSPWQLEWKPDQTAGIGVALTLDGDKLCIGKVLPNGPASRCEQITEGAQLISLSDDSHTKFDLTKATISEGVALIRGPIGSRLTLQIVPVGKGIEEAISVSLRRGRLILE